MARLQFPDGFLWGAATAAHQVEGNQSNDWTDWERSGKINDGSVSGMAADHWNRYEADLDCARELGHTAHRFSVEWSRIEPQYGSWNADAIRHYQDVVHALKRRGIEPVVTLWHFTNPQWFVAKGGWESKDAPCQFARFAEEVVRALPEVKQWMTLNEPNVYALLSYLVGYWPPEVKQWRRALRVYRMMAEAHRQAYDAIKRIRPDASVGFANNVVDYVPARSHNVLDRFMRSFVDRWYNHWFVRQTVSHLDFIGINHYFRQAVRVKSLREPIATEPRGEPLTDYGWGVCPEAMYHVLIAQARYRKPLLITENGCADATDRLRKRFIADELQEVHRAIGDGADVRGYLHWSLMDNFEWREGFSKRFGLVAVDFKTQQRTVRESARWFATVCRNNGFDTD